MKIYLKIFDWLKRRKNIFNFYSFLVKNKCEYIEWLMWYLWPVRALRHFFCIYPIKLIPVNPSFASDFIYRMFSYQKVSTKQSISGDNSTCSSFLGTEIWKSEYHSDPFWWIHLMKATSSCSRWYTGSFQLINSWPQNCSY